MSVPVQLRGDGAGRAAQRPVPREILVLRTELETLKMGQLLKRATLHGVSRARLREFLEREDRSEQRKAIVTAVIEIEFDEQGRKKLRRSWHPRDGVPIEPTPMIS
eukprot:COSAG01_NODE_1963_length_8785_cov_56.285402_5_plen_106_part_00